MNIFETKENRAGILGGDKRFTFDSHAVESNEGQNFNNILDNMRTNRNPDSQVLADSRSEYTTSLPLIIGNFVFGKSEFPVAKWILITSVFTGIGLGAAAGLATEGTFWVTGLFVGGAALGIIGLFVALGLAGAKIIKNRKLS